MVAPAARDQFKQLGDVIWLPDGPSGPAERADDFASEVLAVITVRREFGWLRSAKVQEVGDGFLHLPVIEVSCCFVPNSA